MADGDTRAYWLDVLLRIATPVLEACAEGRLRRDMPVQCVAGMEDFKRQFTHLEALARTLVGIAPWLEVHGLTGDEADHQSRLRELAVRSVTAAVDPGSPDRMNFDEGTQPVVDAAFLCHALLRAPRALRDQLSNDTRARLAGCLTANRVCRAGFNNWLLFAAMVEAALHALDHPWDHMRVDYAVRQHLAWYKGDGVYGDGPSFHWDYYNSFVIQPMLVDILRELRGENETWDAAYPNVLARITRYAAILERLISPEGTIPPIGRSLAYRFGALQALAQAALMDALPDETAPAQVRCGMTAVIRRMIEAPGTFDNNGWLRIGFCGDQPSIGEQYISTGSTYLCTAGLLPLGLPPSHPFWSDPNAPWTAKRAWRGEDMPCDHAIDR